MTLFIIGLLHYPDPDKSRQSQNLMLFVRSSKCHVTLHLVNTIFINTPYGVNYQSVF